MTALLRRSNQVCRAAVLEAHRDFSEMGVISLQGLDEGLVLAWGRRGKEAAGQEGWEVRELSV